LAGFVLASIAARFIFPAVSLEGRQMWLLRSSPLDLRALLWSKYWVGTVPLLVLALLLTGLTNVLLEVGPFMMVMGLVTICGLTFAIAALALGFGALYPQFETENAAQIPDRKSTRLNSSHDQISYAVFCLKKKNTMTRMRTRWILGQPAQVRHDPRPAARARDGSSVQCVPASVRRPLVPEALPIYIVPPARPPACGRGKGNIDPAAAAAVAAELTGGVARLSCGGLMNHMDDADERGRAEGHGRRTAKDLDALDVAKAQGRQRRIERATPGNIVDDQQERVELAKPPELGDRSCRSRIAARCDLDARRESQRILERC